MFVYNFQLILNDSHTNLKSCKILPA